MGRGPAAPSPCCITHGITLRGAQLSWAILHQRKTIENRSVRLSPGWFALHTGVGTIAAARAAEIAAQCPDVPTEASLPHGAIVGAFRIDGACKVADCVGAPSEPWALGPVCNVIGAVCLLPTPIPHRGSLGCWPVHADQLAELRVALADCPVRENGTH